MSVSSANIVESFFDSRVNQRTIRPQLLIATIVGITFSFDMLGAYLTLGEARPTYGGTVLFLAILYFLLPFLIWIMGTISVFVIARLASARAEANILWRMLGWGLFPLAGGGLFLGTGRRLVLSQPCEPMVCDAGQYIRLLEQVEHIYAYLGGALAHTTFQVFFALSVLCFLTTGYLWILAAYKSTTLTRAGATIAAGIPSLALTGLFVLVIL